METVWNYLNYMVNAGGGYVAAVTARTRCGWTMFTECSDFLYVRRFPLMLKGAFCRNYVRRAMLYESEGSYLMESEMGIS